MRLWIDRRRIRKKKEREAAKKLHDPEEENFKVQFGAILDRKRSQKNQDFKIQNYLVLNLQFRQGWLFLWRLYLVQIFRLVQKGLFLD